MDQTKLEAMEWYLVDRVTREAKAGPFKRWGEAVEHQQNNPERANDKILWGMDI